MKTMHGIPAGRLQETVDALTYEQRLCAGVKAGPGAMSDCTIKIWPSRKALEQTLGMQGKRERRSSDWRPIVKPCGHCLAAVTEHRAWCHHAQWSSIT